MQFLQFLFLIHLLFVISPESDDEDDDAAADYATNYDYYSMTQHKILMHNSSIAVFMQKCYWRVLY
jgi:hypothetical protein